MEKATGRYTQSTVEMIQCVREIEDAVSYCTVLCLLTMYSVKKDDGQRNMGAS